MFFKAAAHGPARRLRRLQAAITGPEVIHADGRHAYITYPEGMGRSRLGGTLIESKASDARHRPQLEQPSSSWPRSSRADERPLSTA